VSDVLEAVRAIVIDLRQDETVELDDGTDLFGAGILDSFRILEYIAELERRFDIRFANEDLIPQNLWSIETTAKTLERYLLEGLGQP
jgi:acyl carrier protein